MDFHASFWGAVNDAADVFRALAQRASPGGPSHTHSTRGSDAVGADKERDGASSAAMCKVAVLDTLLLPRTGGECQFLSCTTEPPCVTARTGSAATPFLSRMAERAAAGAAAGAAVAGLPGGVSKEAIARACTALVLHSDGHTERVPVPTLSSYVPPPTAVLVQCSSRPILRLVSVTLGVELTRAGSHTVVKPRVLGEGESFALGSARDTCRRVCTRVATHVEAVARRRLDFVSILTGVDAHDCVYLMAVGDLSFTHPRTHAAPVRAPPALFTAGPASTVDRQTVEGKGESKESADADTPRSPHAAYPVHASAAHDGSDGDQSPTALAVGKRDDSFSFVVPPAPGALSTSSNGLSALAAAASRIDAPSVADIAVLKQTHAREMAATRAAYEAALRDASTAAQNEALAQLASVRAELEAHAEAAAMAVRTSLSQQHEAAMREVQRNAHVERETQAAAYEQRLASMKAAYADLRASTAEEMAVLRAQLSQSIPRTAWDEERAQAVTMKQDLERALKEATSDLQGKLSHAEQRIRDLQHAALEAERTAHDASAAAVEAAVSELQRQYQSELLHFSQQTQQAADHQVLDAHSKALARHHEAEQLRQELNAARATAQQELQIVMEQLHATQHQLAEATADMEKALATHAREVEEVREQTAHELIVAHAQEVRALRQQLDTVQQDAARARQQDEDDAQRVSRIAVEAARAEAASAAAREADELRAAHAAELALLRQRYEQALQEASQTAQKEALQQVERLRVEMMAHSEAAVSHATAAAQRRHEEDLDKLRAQIEDERTVLAAAYERQLADVKASRAEARESSAAELASLRAMLAQSVPSSSLEQLRSQNDAARAALERAHADAAAMWATQLSAAEARVRDAHAQKAQQEEASKRTTEQALTELEERFRRDFVEFAGKVQHDSAQQLANAAQEVTKLRELLLETERISKEHVAEARRTADANHDALMRAQTQLEQTRKVAADDIQRVVSEMQDASTRQVAALEAAHAGQVDMLRAERAALQTQLQESQLRHIEVTTRLQEEREIALAQCRRSMEQQQAHALAAAQAQHAEQIQLLRGSHTSASAEAALQLQRQNEIALADLRRDLELERDVRVQEAQQRATALVDRVREEVQAECTRELQQMGAAYDQRVADLKAAAAEARELASREASDLRRLLSESIPLAKFEQLREEVEARAVSAVDDTVTRARAELEAQLLTAGQRVQQLEAAAADAHAEQGARLAQSEARAASLQAELDKARKEMEEFRALVQQRLIPEAEEAARAAAGQAWQSELASRLDAQRGHWEAALAQAQARHAVAEQGARDTLLEESRRWEQSLEKAQDELAAMAERAMQLEQQMRSQQTQHNREVDSLQRAAKLELLQREDDLQAQHDGEMRRAADVAAAQLVAALGEAESAAKASLQSLEAHLMEQMRARIQQTEQTAAADMQRMRETLQRQHDEALSNAFQNALVDRDASVRKILEEKTAAMQQAEVQHIAAMSALQAQHGAELQQMHAMFQARQMESSDAAARELAATLAAAQRDMRDTLQTAEASWSATLQHTRDSLQQQHEEEMLRQQRAASAAYNSLRAHGERQLMRAEEDRQQLVRLHERVLADAIARSLTEAQDETIAALATMNAEWSQRLQHDIAAVRAEHESMLTALRQQHQRAFEEAQRQSDAVIQRTIASERETAQKLLAEQQSQHEFQLKAELERVAATMEGRMTSALMTANEERQRALAEAQARALQERASALASVREQANMEHEQAMDSLRTESDKLLGNIEGAMSKLRDDRDAARQAVLRLQHKLSASEDTISALKTRCTALLQSGAVHRLQAFGLAARYMGQLHVARTQHQAESAAALQKMIATWQSRVAEVEELLLQERSRSKVLLQFRAKLHETMAAFKRDTVLEHKVRTMEIANDIASMAEQHTDLSKQHAGVTAQLTELETSVRGVEREMAELAKQGVISEDGSVNVTLTRRKKRLDRDLDASLARLADRRAVLDDVKRKMQAVEQTRAAKEEELRAVEADLIATLVQQQRALMALIAGLHVPPGADAAMGVLVPAVATPAGVSPAREQRVEGTFETYTPAPTTSLPAPPRKSSDMGSTIGSDAGEATTDSSSFVLPSLNIASVNAGTAPSSKTPTLVTPGTAKAALPRPARRGDPVTDDVNARQPGLASMKPVAPPLERATSTAMPSALRPPLSATTPTGMPRASGTGPSVRFQLPPAGPSLPSPKGFPGLARSAERRVAGSAASGQRARSDSANDSSSTLPALRPGPAAVKSAVQPPAADARARMTERVGTRSMPVSPSGYEPVIDFALPDGSAPASKPHGLRRAASREGAMMEDDLSDDGYVVDA